MLTEGGLRVRPPLKVGVITPYKKQVHVLRATFSKLLGDAASEVRWWMPRVQGTAPGIVVRAPWWEKWRAADGVCARIIFTVSGSCTLSCRNLGLECHPVQQD